MRPPVEDDLVLFIDVPRYINMRRSFCSEAVHYYRSSQLIGQVVLYFEANYAR